MTHPKRRIRQDEHGTGGIEVLALGFLVLLSGTMIVASAWAVVDTKMAAIAAAREGTRAAVESSSGFSAAGNSSAQQAWTAQGHKQHLTFTLSGNLERCGRVVGEARADVKPLRIPWIGSWGTITVVARHSEIIDPYRSGLKGSANCE
jgi:Flp pilus assembly protein TadG